MTCPCCVSYCHAPDPCSLDVRLRVTWGPVLVVTVSLTKAANANTWAGLTNASVVKLGVCSDRSDALPFDVNARLAVGWSQNAFGNWSHPTFCSRTAQRDARLYNGRVSCMINNGPRYNWSIDHIYDFWFDSLNAQAGVRQFARVDVGGPVTACGQQLIQGFFDTPPQFEVTLNKQSADFCDGRQSIGGFPAVSGPYGSRVQCSSACGNPLL